MTESQRAKYLREARARYPGTCAQELDVQITADKTSMRCTTHGDVFTCNLSAGYRCAEAL